MLFIIRNLIAILFGRLSITQGKGAEEKNSKGFFDFHAECSTDEF